MSRREMLGRSLAAGMVGFSPVMLSACGGSGGSGGAAASGSTLDSTWGDPVGDGQLRVLPGEPLLERLELGPRARLVRPLATLAHVSDAHVMDASSPARVPFLARLGPPFQSTFRPQEALTVQVLAGALRAVRALAPDAVLEGGDLIDNDQENELAQALAVLGGEEVAPGSGPDGYYGVQSEFDPDPFYYRPDVDAPRHPGLLAEAVRRFRTEGLRERSWLPVLGDHDVLVQGEFVPFELTQQLAVGDRALWELPKGLSLPPGLRLQATGAPDAAPDPALIVQFVGAALAGPTVRVPPDPARRELSVDDVVGRLRAAAKVDMGPPTRLDYVRDVGERLRLVVLDLASRSGGSGGVVVPEQAAFLSDAIGSAADRWVILVSHQPLRGSAGAEMLLPIVTGSPRVIATLAGHTHHNRIWARPGGGGGYWEIETASLIDWPQQSRALRLYETEGGGVALETWMLDHVFPEALGRISRELSYLDASGGRPGRFAGVQGDRNAILYLRRGVGGG